jgi:ribosomal protein S18
MRPPLFTIASSRLLHRINPSSLDAQELDPYKEAEAAHDFGAAAPPPFNADEVTRLADYKNAPLLAAFLSSTGKLPGRSATGLRAKLHRRYCRQVKIARIMGVLSPTQRWEPPHKAPAPRGRPGGTLA